MRNQKGFTLIELLIVIVILGILAAAIIPNLNKFVGSGEVGSANAELASVRTGIVAFMADSTTNSLPTDGTKITVDGVTADKVDNSAILEYVVGEIKGIYGIDADGRIVCATNGDWSNKIKWLDGVWVKS